MNAEFLNNGVRLRWLNTAGFEIETSSGTHILLDPFLDGVYKGITCYPFSIDKIEKCDYLLLSHIHFDHAQNVGDLQHRFPALNLFVPDLSADPLCQVQDLDCARLYRTRGGESYRFDDLTIECFTGRHTESPRGYRPSGKDFVRPDGSLDKMMWFGNLELVNYLITTGDGTRILVWAGMTSPDQKYRLADLRPDIALMHISPKQDFEEFAALTEAIGPKVVIPHHYDFTECFFKIVPAAMNDMSEENRRQFVHNGEFDFPAYMQALENACRRRAPGMALLMPEHHKWYRFGFCAAGPLE